jgi:hypothetical protein
VSGPLTASETDVGCMGDLEDIFNGIEDMVPHRGGGGR